MRRPSLREGLAFSTLLVMTCMSAGYLWHMLLPPLIAFLFSVVSGGAIGFTMTRMLITRLRTPLPPSQNESL